MRHEFKDVITKFKKNLMQNMVFFKFLESLEFKENFRNSNGNETINEYA